MWTLTLPPYPATAHASRVARPAVAANRDAQGVLLTFARSARPLAVGLWAALLAALLRPIHQLADVLVFTKVGANGGARCVHVPRRRRVVLHARAVCVYGFKSPCLRLRL